MSRRKPAAAKSRIPSESASRVAKPQADAGVHHYLPSSSAIRETIESLAIAFVLAFLFRTFEAEAFVIPTGSMAPTLMGRHKDLICPICGYPYRVGASEEVDQSTEALKEDPHDQIVACTCPMCRYTANLLKDFPRYPPSSVLYHREWIPVSTVPSYNGDRILVDKLAYEFSEPKRWDVVVFHYPNNATTNYIKRLVGLPGETVRIQNGDIWTCPSGKTEFHIERKRPEKLLAMLQPVFDNDYMPAIARHGWPERWTQEGSGTAGTWRSENYTTFTIDGKAAREQWLRYHHLVPSYDQWNALEERPSRVPTLVPQRITDFTAFDTSRSRGAPAPTVGIHWVGDLAMECTAAVESDAGTLVFELRKGGRQFQCRIDVATGRATLSTSGGDMAQFHPTAITAVRGKGRHEIRFSNCDDELLLWIDGRVVAFDAPTSYKDLENTEPDDGDWTPAGIASAGADLRISHLRLFRDIYYTSVESDDPRRPVGREQSYVDFPLKTDQFFMLGDNSINSQDSRLWGNDHWVDRDLLIGKAMFVYWPHSWDEVRTPWVNIPFPYFPNFARMRLVR